MALYEVTAENLTKISQTTFDQVGLYERNDLQRLLKKQIEVILPDTLIIAEEFGEWDESKRRIDLLGLDKNANLVVIELKRTEDGGHMELQAIRYGAMISTMTFNKVVEVYSRFLANEGRSDTDAHIAILDFLGWESPDEDSFAQDVRIVLASSNFSKELTTAVMWLNKRDLDIRCIRIIPYSDNGRILIDVQQVIPLPEATEYQIQIREKEQKERKEKAERYIIRRRFWEKLLTLGGDKTSLHSKMSPSDHGSIYAAIGVRGLAFYYTVNQHDNRVELYIDRKNKELNKQIFDDFFSKKEEIEAVFGEALIWQRLDEGQGCRIAYEMNGGYRDDETNWQTIQIEMIDAMVRFEKAISPFIPNSMRLK